MVDSVKNILYIFNDTGFGGGMCRNCDGGVGIRRMGAGGAAGNQCVY